MTHLQTTSNYPDMAALETVQQFALLNMVTLEGSSGGPALYAANSFPLNVGYAQGQVVQEVAPPLIACASCQGIDFDDQNGDNESLMNTVIGYGFPGYYVFCALDHHPESYGRGQQRTLLRAGSSFQLSGARIFVYAISITPSGTASLTTYNSSLHPSPF